MSVEKLVVIFNWLGILVRLTYRYIYTHSNGIFQNEILTFHCNIIILRSNSLIYLSLKHLSDSLSCMLPTSLKRVNGILKTILYTNVIRAARVLNVLNRYMSISLMSLSKSDFQNKNALITISLALFTYGVLFLCKKHTNAYFSFLQYSIRNYLIQ